jgi:hypothetical protein
MDCSFPSLKKMVLLTISPLLRLRKLVFTILICLSLTMFSEAWLCIKQGQANINKIIGRFSFGFGMNLGLAKYETKF